MESFDLTGIILDGIKNSASDIHIGVGTQPALRINGSLVRRAESQCVTADDMHFVMERLLTKDQIERFILEREYDFSFNLRHGSGENQRFRGNFSFERGNASLVLRIITPCIRTIKQLCLPEAVKHRWRRKITVCLSLPDRQVRENPLLSPRWYSR